MNPSASPVKLDLCCWLCQSPEVDVFAAGVILYFMLRGKLPFSANTQEETLEFLGLSKRSMYIYIYKLTQISIYIYININETAEMTGHHAAWNGRAILGVKSCRGLERFISSWGKPWNATCPILQSRLLKYLQGSLMWWRWRLQKIAQGWAAQSVRIVIHWEFG